MSSSSFRLGSDGIYRCDALQQFFWQKHGFGTRSNNPEAHITLKQVHSDRVWNASGLKDGVREGDALITDCVGKSIGVRTADCVPILLLDPEHRAVGVVHAGWRGTAHQVVKRTIERMQEDFQTSPENLFAAVGPCIRDCCYAVGPEVAEQFAPLFPDWKPLLAGKHRTLDLAESNRRQMEESGVRLEQVFDCGLCTTCQAGQFYSFRREPENAGRMVAAIERLA